MGGTNNEGYRNAGRGALTWWSRKEEPSQALLLHVRLLV